MKTRTGKILTPKTFNDSLVSAPNTLYASKILGKDIEIENSYLLDKAYTSSLGEMWNQQHPLIHTWFVLSSISICCLSALLLVMH